MRNAIWVIILWLSLTGCAEQYVTAAERVNADATAEANAQWVQFERDTNATATARANQFMAQQAEAESTAEVARSTQAALAAQQTADARSISTATARAESALSTATARAESALSTATARAEVQAAGTAQVRATLTAIELSQRQSEALRLEWLSYGMAILIVALGAIILILTLGWGMARIRQMAVVYYGLHKNPLVMIGGAIYDPIAHSWSGEDIPPDLQSQLTTGLQQVLALQAGHSPHKAEPPTRERHTVKIGPVTRETETTTGTTPITVSAPELPKQAPAQQLPPPEDPPIQRIFIKTDVNSKLLREQQDIVEFIQDGWGARGLSRRAWVGRQMTTTGNKIGRGYYDATMKMFEQAGLVEKSGDGWRTVVGLDEALDAFGLAHGDFGLAHGDEAG